MASMIAQTHSMYRALQKKERKDAQELIKRRPGPICFQVHFSSDGQETVWLCGALCNHSSSQVHYIASLEATALFT